MANISQLHWQAYAGCGGTGRLNVRAISDCVPLNLLSVTLS